MNVNTHYSQKRKKTTKEEKISEHSLG